MYLKLFVALMTTFFLLSCSEESTEPKNNEPVDKSIYKISGSIVFDDGYELPQNARIVVCWMVSWTSPDYGYFWTEGTIDRANNSFKIAFDTIPGDSCLNIDDSLKFGVAYIFVLDEFSGNFGILDEEFFAKVIGAVDDRAIIYFEGNTSILETRFFNFQKGFNFGKGWYNPGQGVDGWESVDINNIQIRIGNMHSFTFPNWT